MRLVAAVLALLLAVAPAATAQQYFEGVISMNMQVGEKLSPATAYVKGTAARYDLGSDSDLGGMILNGKGDLVMLVPKQKQYYVMNVSGMVKDARAKLPPTTYTKLGKTETIAGMPCTYYRASRGKEVVGESCMTTAMGFVGVDLGGDQSMMSAEEMAQLRKTFPKGGFPLKLIDGETGEVKFVVTKVAKQAVPDSMFAPPVGWKELKAPGTPSAGKAK